MILYGSIHMWVPAKHMRLTKVIQILNSINLSMWKVEMVVPGVMYETKWSSLLGLLIVGPLTTGCITLVHKCHNIVHLISFTNFKFPSYPYWMTWCWQLHIHICTYIQFLDTTSFTACKASFLECMYVCIATLLQLRSIVQRSS